MGSPMKHPECCGNRKTSDSDVSPFSTSSASGSLGINYCYSFRKSGEIEKPETLRVEIPFLRKTFRKNVKFKARG